MIHDTEESFLIVDDSVQEKPHAKAIALVYPLQAIEWSQERLTNGVLVKLKEVPFFVRLFKLVATNGDIDWIITNDPTVNLIERL